MSRNIFSYSAVVASLLATALFAGCGTSNKEGSASLGDVAKVGDTACIQCHSATVDALTGESIITQYNKSVHFQTGQGCESCHGGGALHNGVGPIPFARPDATRCATCHTGTNSTGFADSNHALLDLHYSATSASPVCLRCHSHEGAVIFNQRGITGDKTFLEAATTTSQLTLDRDGTKFQAINCQTCHEHGGALRAQKAQDGTGAIVSWDPNKNVKVDQFDLCTSCHTYLANDGTTLVASATAIAGRTAFIHNNRWTRMIATTHYDNPATGVGLASTLVEGYVIRTKSANPCFDCHGHEAKTATGSTTESTIHTDWAMSAHAGGLLEKKLAAVAANPTRNDAQVDAVIAAGVDGTSGPAWEHYNWDNSTGNASSSPDPDRKSCQRCHTSTGAANFMTSPATYNAANNSFTHLSGWTSTNKTSPQNELLYCWGCHSNAGKGILRTPGAITETYAAGTTGDPATTIAYPDAGNSNVCMSCHLGREAGDVIKNDQDADGVRSFINSHYLTAGGTVFGKTGYTYFGRDYNSSTKGFVHDKLGISATGTAAADAYIAANGLSTSGPCAVCHMTSVKLGKETTHTFSPFSLYSTTVKNTALNPVCVTCHSTRGDGSNAKSAWFEATWKARSDAALAALEAQLALKGIHFFNAHPYFYQGAGGTGGAFTNWAGVNGLAEWKNVMGAAFNYNLIEHDPGAVAHNRYYVRRLIYDSLDYLDDMTANYSVFATLNALDATTATYKADAITFLINRGTADANVGTAAERY